MADGWIKVYRKIKECWIYDDKPFDRTHAWIDLLLRANHQDNKVALGNEFIEIKRGSFITSELKLMNTWGWSKTKVRNFLKLLKDDGMIEIIADKKKTTINIVNYSNYQDFGDQEKTTKKPIKDYEKTIKRPRKNTNNNDNNNKELNIYTQIINYLNEKAETAFRSTTKKTKDLISARQREGFALDDFKKVIDIKATEWKGTDMQKYLRPETLFGTKFEGYLNQKVSTSTNEDGQTDGSWERMKKFS